MATVITSISGLQNLTNLQTFNADWNSLQTVDLSGLTQLTQVDISDCDTLDGQGKSLTSVNLSGCTAIEQLRLDDSDFSAGMPNISGLTALQYLDMDQCGITGTVNVSMFPALNFLDLSGNTGLTSVTFGEQVFGQLFLNNTAINQATVDAALQLLDAGGADNGNVNLSGGTAASPSQAGQTAKTSLLSKGWEVQVNQVMPTIGITGAVPASTSVVFTASLSNPGYVTIQGAGIIVSDSNTPTPTFLNAVGSANLNSLIPGTRTATISGLTPSTQYFVRAFVEVDGQTIYGNVISTILTLA